MNEFKSVYLLMFTKVSKICSLFGKLYSFNVICNVLNHNFYLPYSYVK